MSVFRPTTFLILCTAIFLLCTSCNDQKIISVKPSVIPNPEQLTRADGHFVWDDDVFLEVDDSLQPAAELLTLYTEKSTGKYASQGSKKISLKLDSSIANNEGYKLVVSPESIQLTSSSLAGAFRGVQTIRQLLPPCIENGSCDGKISIPSVTVVDAPKFIYRGLHLDVGRHFFPVDFVKKYIDMIALMKMNTFHWHLTEDQGWRIEIKKYPRLTSHGAYRKETIIGHNNDEPQQFDGKRYGGFYTQDEIKEVVQYATERGITIIPEIEMPGHSQAAISAYPELGCTGDSIDVATKWGVFEDIYCPREETFAFLEDVLDEVMALFPSEYIHIGGDEAPKKRWKECKYCQELIKREGLKDEHGLQSYFKYSANSGRWLEGLSRQGTYSFNALRQAMQAYRLDYYDQQVRTALVEGTKVAPEMDRQASYVADEVSSHIVKRRIANEQATYNNSNRNAKVEEWENFYDESVGKSHVMLAPLWRSTSRSSVQASNSMPSVSGRFWPRTTRRSGAPVSWAP